MVKKRKRLLPILLPRWLRILDVAMKKPHKKMKKKQAPSLSPDLWLKIFSQLSNYSDYCRSIVAVRSVCKEWREICCRGFEDISLCFRGDLCKHHGEDLTECNCLLEALDSIIMSSRNLKYITLDTLLPGIPELITRGIRENKLTNICILDLEVLYETTTVFCNLISSLGSCTNLRELKLKPVETVDDPNMSSPSLPALPKLRCIQIQLETESRTIERFVENAPMLEDLLLFLDVTEPLSLKLPNASSVRMKADVGIKLEAPEVKTLELMYCHRTDYVPRRFELPTGDFLEDVCLTGSLPDWFLPLRFPLLRRLSLCPTYFRYGQSERIPLDSLFLQTGLVHLEHLKVNLTFLSRIRLPEKRLNLPALKHFTVDAIERMWHDEREESVREQCIADVVRCVLDQCRGAHLELEADSMAICYHELWGPTKDLLENLVAWFVEGGGQEKDIPWQIMDLLRYKRNPAHFIN